MDIPYCGIQLAAPGLPQAQAGVLDLSADAVAKLGAVQVLVPAYPKRNPGDRIIVSFTPSPAAATAPAELRRYRYLQDPGADPDGSAYQVLIEPLWALPAYDYEVGYMVTSRTGNTAVSQGVAVSVRNTPQPPPEGAAVVGQGSLSGTYLPGTIVQSWVVQQAGALADTDGVLRQALGKSTAGAVLAIYRATPPDTAGQRLLALTAGEDGTTWSASADNGALPAQFARADLVQVKLEATVPQQIFLALAL